MTILSESTVAYERGLKAIPIAETCVEEKQMEGCIHLLKKSYIKKSSKEFIGMLSESISRFALSYKADTLMSSSIRLETLERSGKS